MPTPLPSYRPAVAPLPPVDLEEARERAVRLLSDGYAYDQLSEAEFEWRVDRLNKSTSAAAIDALVADLLVPAASPAATPVAPEAHGRLLALMSEASRVGVWTVPARLEVVAVMSQVRLDLRHAQLPPACTIELFGLMANVHVIVPPGLPVYLDVGAVMASTRNDAVSLAPPAAGVPCVIVRGAAMMSEVRVRVRARNA